MNILKLKIKQGEYSVGQIVVPQNFTKTTIKGVHIWTEIFLRRYTKKSAHLSFKIYAPNNRWGIFKYGTEWGATKIKSENSENLEELLIKLEKKKKMERTRYFAFWHDGSTIGNHSHFLIIVNVLYGPASFLSDKEY